MDLKLSLEPLLHPLMDEAPSKYEAWGNIHIHIGEKEILNWQWDVMEVLEWFLGNEFFLKKEVFPSSNTPICLAEFRDQVFEKELSDQEIDEWAAYFSRHRFHLRGTDSVKLYIGLVNDIEGEVSYKVGGDYFSHEFKMVSFLMQAKEELLKFFDVWEKEFASLEGLERLANEFKGWKNQYEV